MVDLKDSRVAYSLFLNRERDFGRELRYYLGSLNGKKILDAGCGCCWVDLAIVKHFPEAEVFGFDYAREIIKFSDYITEKTQLESNRFVASWDDELPWRDSSFDIALMINTLHHTDTPIHVLKNIRNKLKPGGVLFCNEPFLANTRIRFLKKRARRKHIENAARVTEHTGEIENRYDESAYRRFLEKAGFTDIRFEQSLLGLSGLKRYKRKIRNLLLTLRLYPFNYSNIIIARKE